MFKVLLPKIGNANSNGFDDIDRDRELKKMKAGDLAMRTFKRLDSHIQECAANSAATLNAVKFVGWVVFLLAVEKLNEMFHFVQHIPTLPGG